MDCAGGERAGIDAANKDGHGALAPGAVPAAVARRRGVRIGVVSAETCTIAEVGFAERCTRTLVLAKSDPLLLSKTDPKSLAEAQPGVSV